jgi:Uri superfamily endonuclease
VQIGRLGEFTFPAGAYLYFGSACGPGGLSARLTRHLLPASPHPLHWHIDYLRAVAEIRALTYLAGSCQERAAQRLECLWSQAVAGLTGSLVPAPGFGASDCRSRCPAHLLTIQEPGAARGPTLLDVKLQNILTKASGQATIQINTFDASDIDLCG